jgi:scyllo-inositol 2-dehydrogenase (NADP+)
MMSLASDSSSREADASAGSSAPLRCGIIGYGLAGTVFHAPLIASTPGMLVAAISTSHPDRRLRAQRDYPGAIVYPSAQALLADPSQLDLIVVATPNRAHAPLGIAAMSAGLPVVIDKPLAASVAAAEELLATARRTGKLLTVFQNRRWDNDFLTVRRLIDAQALGQVVRVESRFERFRPALRENAWRESADPEDGGGLLFDLGPHLIDQVRLLFGQPTSVYAESDARRAGAAVDDDTFIALRFSGGQVAHLWASVIPRRPGPRFRIIGTEGVYEKDDLDPQEAALAAGARPSDPGWGTEPRERWGRVTTSTGGLSLSGLVETVTGSYETFYALLLEALRSGAPPPVDPADALAVQKIIEAARESARTGAVIRTGDS